MSNRTITHFAPAALLVGSAFGMAGTFVSSASVRGIAWGIDGVALIVAFALLSVHFTGRGNVVLGAGFLTFLAGQTLVLATAASDLSGASKVFGAGTALWAAALLMVSSERYAPPLLRMAGVLAAALFAATAAQILWGVPLDALSKPLPFFAYPALVATLLGWAWTLWRETPE